MQPIWVMGLCIFLAGQGCGFIALNNTPQTIVATLGAFSLVSNGVFAPCILGERIQRQDFVSIIVILIGSVLVVFSAPSEAQEYSKDRLLSLCKQTLFLVYMIVLLFLLIAALTITSIQVQNDI